MGSGPVIWIHVGDDPIGAAGQSLADKLASERSDLDFVFTSSAEHPVSQEGGHKIYAAPEETVPAARRFIQQIRPSVSIWTEPELRPALVVEAAETGNPLFLFDAQTDENGLNGRQWSRGMVGSLYGRFDRVLTGNRNLAERLDVVGYSKEKIETTGYLRASGAALPYNEKQRRDFATALAGRPVWLAACVSLEEIDAVLAAHALAQRKSHRLLLILLPHLANQTEVEAQLQKHGCQVSYGSKGELPEQEIQVFLVDDPAELGLWYRLAPISFLGQSFGGGGIDPLPASALGSAIAHGPDVSNHATVYSRFQEAGAAMLVKEPAKLGDAIESLLSPAKTAEMAHAGWNLSSEGAEVSDRAVDLVLTALDDL